MNMSINTNLNRLPLSFMGIHRIVYGGPYRSRPNDHFGVKMAAEIKAPCNVDIPTRDFSIPDPHLMAEGIRKTLPALFRGDAVYVGCMGGIGRTGLFLGILTSVLNPKADPVAYVRKHYMGHAIETEEQRRFVREFPVNDLRAYARRLAVKYWLLRLIGRSL